MMFSPRPVQGHDDIGRPPPVVIGRVHEGEPGVRLTGVEDVVPVVLRRHGGGDGVVIDEGDRARVHAHDSPAPHRLSRLDRGRLAVGQHEGQVRLDVGDGDPDRVVARLDLEDRAVAEGDEGVAGLDAPRGHAQHPEVDDAQGHRVRG